ncbi:MAG: XdhC family protein [Betaproteobacteria bacterium]|jgi:xanthine dehydrogenase accessory factor|nr:XdhC family protein [Pseudomonadota bacterium]NBO03433.1 XdhC family protein [Betaproteobacteria bacterium]NBP35033.1 XdhC family protein [Betaproteobacteria bacterium]NBP38649.1 XdhC family protein [Betaproteobacteria bacterium]NBQ78407.1 XdhC family protein [Betaproteobacteria bacterium]
MDSTDFSVLNTCIGWMEQARRVALVTVVETWGSSPRPVGSWLAVRDDGQVVGSVSGGCVEDDLIAKVQTEIMPASMPHTLLYGVSKEEAARFGLPCGGSVRVVVEPQPSLEGLRQLRSRVAEKRMSLRVLDMTSGRFEIRDASRADHFHFDGQIMHCVHGPRWRIVMIGAGQLSQYLCQMALAADYQIVVIDPRDEFAEGIQFPGVECSRGMPDDELIRLEIDNHTAVVALTHDPKLDDMALLEALKSPAFYIGALGSRANTAKRKERLKLFDLSETEIARLHGPVGLFIGAKTPPEMAISILAEVTAAKYGVEILQRRDAQTPLASACTPEVIVQ